MDDWTALRTGATVVIWVVVAGGLVLAITWLARGGVRAIGPEDRLLGQSSVPAKQRRRTTSFGAAQVGIHGLLGVMTASLLTYAAVRTTDRSTGYAAVLVALAVTAVPGSLMFAKWRRREQPGLASEDLSGGRERAEDRLPRPVVYAHGLAAVGTAALVLILLVVD
jgi:uncharacterized protein (DUF2237 family)